MAEYRTSRWTGAIDSRVLLGFALIGVIFCILAVAVLQYLNKQQRSTLTRRIEELETQKATAPAPAGGESFALAIAKVKQEETLPELRKATNLLEKLSANLSQLFKRSEVLPTNESAARQLFEKAIASSPTLAQVQARRAETESNIFQIQSAQGTAYLPDLHIISEAKKTAEWASANSVAVTGFRERLDQILGDPKGENSAAPATPVESNSSNISDAKKDTAERLNFLAEMKAEADRILAETRAEAARILVEMKDEARRILADAEKKADTILASTKDKPAVQEAVPVAEAPKITSASVPLVQEAEEPKQQTVPFQANGSQFQKVIEDAGIRTELLPFTTPGNMRLPGMFRAQRVPISLTQLKNFGALEPTVTGLERLVQIATTEQDAIRPRWKFKRKRGVWQRSPDEIAQARTVQQLFIDFGPDFVSAGLLSE